MNEKKPNQEPEFRPTANPVRNAAMIDLRSSGAAGTHQDGRDRRARTRAAAKDRAITDQELE